jgi:hypothetical protein
LRCQGILLLPRLFPKGIVPYTIDDNFTEDERAVIAASILTIEQNSCVRWVARVGDENPSVRITKEGEGCFASVGYKNYGFLNLGSGCIVSKPNYSTLSFLVGQNRPKICKP